VCVYMAALPSSRCARDLLFSNVRDVNLVTKKRVCLCLCEKSVSVFVCVWMCISVRVGGYVCVRVCVCVRARLCHDAPENLCGVLCVR